MNSSSEFFIPLLYFSTPEFLFRFFEINLLFHRYFIFDEASVFCFSLIIYSFIFYVSSLNIYIKAYLKSNVRASLGGVSIDCHLHIWFIFSCFFMSLIIFVKNWIF